MSPDSQDVHSQFPHRLDRLAAYFPELQAVLGRVNRFPKAKKLVGYIGLSPSQVQSANNAKGREKGTGNTGRVDVRAL